jgi:hypothetical protein
LNESTQLYYFTSGGGAHGKTIRALPAAPSSLRSAIGAIGVSGAPGGQFDEACAREALAKIQDRMK